MNRKRQAAGSPVGEPSTPSKLPRRSQGAPPALLEPICLRCAKRVATAGRATCGKQANRNCGYCRRLNKSCQAVPEAFHSRLNELLALIDRAERRRVTGEDTADLDARVAAAQKSFTKDVEALVRTGVKHGLRQRPKGEDFPLLQVQELQAIRRTLEGILNVMRASANMPPIVRDEEEDKGEEDEDEGEEDVEGEEEEEEEGEGEEEREDSMEL